MHTAWSFSDLALTLVLLSVLCEARALSLFGTCIMYQPISKAVATVAPSFGATELNLHTTHAWQCDEALKSYSVLFSIHRNNITTKTEYAVPQN